MFKITMNTLLLSSTLFGGLLDFRTLDTAKNSYEEGQYEKSAQAYDSLENKNDDVHYNLGNAYYKDKKYDKAIAEFKQVQRPELKAKALHNIGNAYAQSKKVDEAIKAYEEALKLGADEDTQFNLDLLKKEKEKQQKQDQKNKDQQDKKDKQDKNDQQDKQNKDQKDQEKKDKQKDDQKNKDQQKNDQKSQDQKDKESKENQENSDKQEEKSKEQEAKEKKEREEKAKEEQKKKEEAEAAQGEPKELPISDMQERKYEKMLDKRGIKTLMVPLKTEGGHDDETTAW